MERFKRIWQRIGYRCSGASFWDRKSYFDKGIKCLWTSFEEFRNDMYESYINHVEKFGEFNTQIDRIDNNGNYCKENCRWVTHKENQRNRADNHMVEFDGKRLCITEWAEITGISHGTITDRLERGWDAERTLTQKVGKYRKYPLN